MVQAGPAGLTLDQAVVLTGAADYIESQPTPPAHLPGAESMSRQRIWFEAADLSVALDLPADTPWRDLLAEVRRLRREWQAAAGQAAPPPGGG